MSIAWVVLLINDLKYGLFPEIKFLYIEHVQHFYIWLNALAHNSLIDFLQLENSMFLCHHET